MDPEDRDDWWDKAAPSTVHLPPRKPASRDPATHVRINPRIRYVRPSTRKVPRRPWFVRAWAWLWR